MIAVTGDEPCPKNPQLRRWGAGSARIHARVEAAIRAASANRSKPLNAQDLTIVGYSEGALRAEAVAKRFPERYSRVALIGQPTRPSAHGFLPTQTIASVVGSRDYQQNMREGAKALEGAGLAVKFFVLPHAGHGEYGPDAERTMSDVFAHLFSDRTQSPPPVSTNKP
jgi:pimeloyl-ACP methyl ester carboxylesterase